MYWAEAGTGGEEQLLLVDRWAAHFPFFPLGKRLDRVNAVQSPIYPKACERTPHVVGAVGFGARTSSIQSSRRRQRESRRSRGSSAPPRHPIFSRRRISGSIKRRRVFAEACVLLVGLVARHSLVTESRMVTPSEIRPFDVWGDSVEQRLATFGAVVRLVASAQLLGPRVRWTHVGNHIKPSKMSSYELPRSLCVIDWACFGQSIDK